MSPPSAAITAATLSCILSINLSISSGVIKSPLFLHCLYNIRYLLLLVGTLGVLGAGGRDYLSS